MQTRHVDMKAPSINNKDDLAANTEDDFLSGKTPLPKREKKVNLGDLQRALQDTGPQQQTKNIDIKSSEKNAIDLTANTTSGLGKEWIRQDMTSFCFPYKFNQVFLKTITIPVLSMIHASNVNSSFTLLVDALDQCINVDIRDLTPQDFTLVMYWLRDNSLPRSPMKVDYTTRYGNTVEINTRRSEMQIKELDMTKEEVEEWRSKGIVFPTVRDAEIITRNSEIEPEKAWMLEYAQYIEYIPGVDRKGNPITDYSDYIPRKIERLTELGLDIIPMIDKFKTLIDHGVVEVVKVIDSKYDPLKAIDYFTNESKNIVRRLNAIPDDQVFAAAPAILFMAESNSALIEEIKEIRQQLEAGITPKAKEEVVTVQISATSFFPSL